ncbi:hypothetical protein [Ferrimonas sp. YFM]|uniref:hypothetical protein n=1 Tax=Ferrimonas sp. YFM TaxID=3028878 RepID=UPI0025745AA9|nr:hypothetical protein [Ferrimonas sp. YFM]BDY07053.1 hypothetical protein F0521_40940 [Ferrimonas sp. YFM]
MSLSGFKRATVSEFAYLEESFGFSRVDGLDGTARYESDEVIVIVSYDFGHGYDLEVCIGQQGRTDYEPEETFDLREVAMLKGVEALDLQTSFAAASEESMVRCLEKMASLLLDIGPDLLKGDAEAFLALKEQRDLESHELAIETRLSHIRRQLGPAWQAKDYKQVEELLRNVEHLLTESEKNKLSFSRRQLWRQT